MSVIEEDSKNAGQERYDEYWAKQMADPEFRRVYQEEAAKKKLWLQLVEACHDAGLTQTDVAKRLGVSQALVARIEERGYDSCALDTLRNYLQDLGGDFSIEVKFGRAGRPASATAEGEKVDAECCQVGETIHRRHLPREGSDQPRQPSYHSQNADRMFGLLEGEASPSKHA